MDEASKYADMIEIPVNTCNITVKPSKKRKSKKKKTDEEIKAQVIDMVNTATLIDNKSNSDSLNIDNVDDYVEIYHDKTMDDDFKPKSTLSGEILPIETSPDESIDNQISNKTLNQDSVDEVVAKKGFFRSIFSRGKKSKTKSVSNEVNNKVVNATDDLFDNDLVVDDKAYDLSLLDGKAQDLSLLDGDNQNLDNFLDDNLNNVSTVNISTKPAKKPLRRRVFAEVGVATMLIAVVIGSAFLISGNGLKDLFVGVFSSKKEEVKEYTDFSANLPCVSNAISLDDGVIKVNYKGSVYAPTDGLVSSVYSADDKITIEITHSQDFKTVITGLDFGYFSVGDKVYSTIPVGYSNGEEVTVCLYSGDGLIKDFSIDSGKIVWVTNAE